MSLPIPKEGEVWSASVWNAYASEINRTWAMTTDGNFELVKGEPWRLRYTAAAVREFNGPVWEIFVWRPTATHSFDTASAPAAIYLTGPFTAFGTTDALRIAKLVDSGTRTDIDATFSANCGFIEAPTYFRQRLGRCFDNDTLLVACGAGIEFQDGGNANGLFFQFDGTGTLAHSPPWSVPESLIPTITTNGTITGIASYGETIALSLGQINTPAGLVLFDSAGNIQESVTGSGDYIRQDGGSADSYRWIIADAESYVYGVELEAGVPNPQGFKKINAAIAAGFSDDAIWFSNAGTGCSTGGSSAAPTISPSTLHMHAELVDWNGTPTTTPIAPILNSGFPFRGILEAPGINGVPALSNIVMLCESHVTDSLVFIAALNPETLYILRQDTSTLTTLNGFNDAVSDVKFFRLKDDLVTEQYIVAGDFTTYNGEPAPYLIFIDQNGNRLADLEWP